MGSAGFWVVGFAQEVQKLIEEVECGRKAERQVTQP